jgi:FtsP/CotA-like multicopper oxidase with cupredoxin domain
MNLRPFSRRQFLYNLAAGGTLTPVWLLTGCKSKPGPRPEINDEENEHGLRASRFQTAPDGRSREVMGYNEKLPGPVLRVKEGDTLRVEVENAFNDVPTSVHWHGMHQPGTFQMDGVPDVSGPPIPIGKKFVYKFKATPAGTHWYHSHVGVQYGNGLFGPLIVEEREPIAAYDREEILFINDWFLQPGDTLMADILKGAFMKMSGKKDGKEGMKLDVGDVPFQSGLINGKGRAPGNTTAPLTVVEVKKGETVRLRLINGSSTFAFRFQVDGHPLTVIATDGAPMIPVQVDNLVLAVGERYDVLLKATQDGVHWIRAATLDGNEVHAVLRYAGATKEPKAAKVSWGEKILLPRQMRSRQQVELAREPKDMVINLGGSMKPYRWSINGQYYPKADAFELSKDEWVRMALRNPTGMDHPFHLHGHYFFVLGKPGALNLKDPVQKDTINVPTKGEVIIQWQAKNPGRWFFHCHIEWHLDTGMARVIEIKPS